jgi:hypothetical protein
VLALVAAVAAGVAVTSGGSGADPRTPPALAGIPAPFLGTAVVGNGGLTAAIDAYGNVVDMRAPGPAGAALIENPADRQAAGSVSPRTGIVPLVRIGDEPARAMWEAESIRQRYLVGTNVVKTVATFSLGPGRPGAVEVEINDAARGQELARLVRTTAPPGVRLTPSLSVDAEMSGCAEERRGPEVALVCSPTETEINVFAEVERVFDDAAESDPGWLGRARPLGAGAPGWAERMYKRSLLVLRALTDRRTGAVAAGARDGWAYVWPRDAGAAALALAASGYRPESRRVARFLLGLDLDAAARFHGDGAPVPGRAAQGDAAAWVAAATGAAGNSTETAINVDMRRLSRSRWSWRDLSDYQEGAPGDFLANAIATGEADLAKEFQRGPGLVHRADDLDSGLDSAAAWAVRPFPRPALFPAVRKTLLRLADESIPFGITPGEAWPGIDPWTAPTAWSAWSLAALGERTTALDLLAALRRAATPAGALPERVDARTGIPRSTTPLAWSHAFAILALRELWPRQKRRV